MTPAVLCAERRHDVDGIVFDKDVTLIDLDRAWGARARGWVDRIAAELEGCDAAAIGASIDEIDLG